MKVMIASPALLGNITCKFTESLINTLFEFQKQGIATRVYLKKSSSLLIAERNHILDYFMKSDCTHLMCIDSDIGWKPQDIIRLLKHDFPLVGCVYLSRDKNYIVRLSSAEVTLDEKGVFVADAIPMGFCLIRRDAVEKMQAHFPELYYKGEKDEGYGFFNTMVRDHEFWGEDYSFFLRAKDAGILTYVDPHISLIHGENEGRLLESLITGKFIKEGPNVSE